MPFLDGLSARHVEFSRDGRWIAYVLHPEGTLWRSRADGTDRRQLTFPPRGGGLPRWSPDGRRIAYMSRSAGEPWRIARRRRRKAGSRKPVTGQPGEVDPTWSPDGTKLVVGGHPDCTTGPPAILVVDLRPAKVSTFPGSEGLYSPRWSPDGRSIVALSADAIAPRALRVRHGTVAGPRRRTEMPSASRAGRATARGSSS